MEEQENTETRKEPANSGGTVDATAESKCADKKTVVINGETRSSKSHNNRPPNLSMMSVAASTSNIPTNSSNAGNTTTNNVGINVPVSSQCDSAQTDSNVAGLTQKAPTEVMSPRSYSVFKSGLVHVPEMNLPWESMRKSMKCACGITFSYSVRKVLITMQSVGNFECLFFFCVCIF